MIKLTDKEICLMSGCEGAKGGEVTKGGQCLTYDTCFWASRRTGCIVFNISHNAIQNYLSKLQKTIRITLKAK